MKELSAFILAYNEAENIPELMGSLKGVRDVVVLDNGSTDNTVELFKSLGARVYDGSSIGKYVATADDVSAFKDRYGFDPLFTAGEIFDHAGERRNHAASLCRNDWVFNPDCDERPEWDLKKIKPLLNGQAGISHRYIFKHNPDGSPLIEFIQCKLYNRQLSCFMGRIHEVLVAKETGNPAPVSNCAELAVHHWQKERPYRDTHLRQLEFQVVKEENVRTLNYLGREYMDQGNQWDKALNIYNRSIKINNGDFPQQRAQTFLYMAECFKSTGKIANAIEACYKAMMLDDTSRWPFFLLGEIYYNLGFWQRAKIYFTAATAIPYNPNGFLTDMRLYTWATDEMLYRCHERLGEMPQAKWLWERAMSQVPDGPDRDRIAHDSKLMFVKANA